MCAFIDIYGGLVHALRQNTVSTNVFGYGVTKHCKYQPFGPQRAKDIVNSHILLMKLLKDFEIGSVE